MRTQKFNRPSFTHNLERVLLSRGIKPSSLNMNRFVSDLIAAVDDAEHKSPHAILNELGARFRATLPAYSKTKPFGPRLPAADNVKPHTPAVDDADFLLDHRAPFHVDQWLQALASLTQWATNNVKENPHTLRLEQILADLLIEHPDIAIGDRTARMLAGQVGMDRLAEILAAGSRERYYGEDRVDDAPRMDLNAGLSAWNF